MTDASVRVAAIDCGTNSIRLLVLDAALEDGRAVGRAALHRENRIVRLGQGVDATGRIAPEAMERTVAASRDYAALCAAHEVQEVRFVATSATRDARTRDRVLAMISERGPITAADLADTLDYSALAEIASARLAGRASIPAARLSRSVRLHTSSSVSSGSS